MVCYGTVCSYTFTIHCTLYIRNENEGTKEGLFCDERIPTKTKVVSRLN